MSGLDPMFGQAIQTLPISLAVIGALCFMLASYLQCRRFSEPGSVVLL